MKLLFINLCARRDTKKKIPNIGLAFVMECGKKKQVMILTLIDIDLHRYTDKEFEAKLQEGKWDFVAMEAMASMYKQTKQAAAQVRKYQPQATIALGKHIGNKCL